MAQTRPPDSRPPDPRSPSSRPIDPKPAPAPADPGTPLERLREMRERTRVGGGPERIAAQHKKGKLTARERIDFLVDEASFVELDRFVTHRCTDFDMQAQQVLGDGVVTG